MCCSAMFSYNFLSIQMYTVYIFIIFVDSFSDIDSISRPSSLAWNRSQVLSQKCVPGGTSCI